MYEMLWPTHYDLGVKWLRLNMWGGPLQWSFVEQERGKYVIDRRADEAITEAVESGIRILMNLSYGNWLYAPKPRKNFASSIWDIPYDFPPDPITPEMKEGFKNYVRFMVKHFKGRVQWYEVYNEPFYSLQAQGRDEEMLRLYCDLFKEVAPIIRKEDPTAKISLAGGPTPGRSDRWLYAQLEILGREGMAYVDAYGFHIQGNEYPGLRDYAKNVKRFRKDVAALGFQGLFMANEYWIAAPYPPDKTARVKRSEIQKAKETARVFLLNLGLGILPFWCDTWKDGLQEGAGIFRNTFGSDPIPPQQPEAVYYVLRTLCTIMDGAKPIELEVEVSNKTRAIDNYNFALPGNEMLVGLWLTERSQDDHPGVKTDLIISQAKASRIIGIDTLNGFEKELQFQQKADRIVVQNLLVRDYPLMIKVVKL
jgi:hypothetical protein